MITFVVEETLLTVVTPTHEVKISIASICCLLQSKRTVQKVR